MCVCVKKILLNISLHEGGNFHHIKNKSEVYPFRFSRNFILQPAAVGTDLVIDTFNLFPLLKKRVGICKSDDTDSTREGIRTIIISSLP